MRWFNSSSFLAGVALPFLCAANPMYAQLNAMIVDPTFVAPAGVSGGALTLQPDGKVILGNVNMIVGGILVNGVARLDANGPLDTSFTIGGGANLSATAVAIQPDGHIVGLGGPSGLFRLNSDGTRDAGFTYSDPVPPMMVRACSSGIYILDATNGVRRVTSAGAIDATFAITGEIQNFDVLTTGRVVAVLKDHNGSYGYWRYFVRIVRADGSVVTEFNIVQDIGSNLGTVQLAPATAGRFYTSATIGMPGSAIGGGAIGFYTEDGLGAGGTASPTSPPDYRFVYGQRRNRYVAADPTGGFYVDGSAMRLASFPNEWMTMTRVTATGDADPTFQVTRGPTDIYYKTSSSEQYVSYSQFDGSGSDGTPFYVTPDGKVFRGLTRYQRQTGDMTVTTLTPLAIAEGSSLSYAISVPGSATYAVIAGNSVQGTSPAGSVNITLSGTDAVFTSTRPNAGTYLYYVWDSTGNVRRYTRTITVIPSAPFFRAEPTSTTAAVGTQVSLTADIGGSASTVTWYRNGFLVPGANSATFAIGSVSDADYGEYYVVATNSLGTVISQPVQVTPRGRPLALSIRSLAGSGDATLIAGIAISGLSTAKKTVLIRVGGPSLAQYGITNYVKDPALAVYDGTSSLVATNSDWAPALAADFTTVGATAWTSGSKDSAIKLQLAPGAYTIHAVNPETVQREVLIEVFDFSKDSQTSLAAVSCRTTESVGSPVIAGIVTDVSSKLLVRHSGPALKDFGVNTAAEDTRLRVFSMAAVELASNDNWDASLQSTFSTVGAFTLKSGSKDAAMSADSLPTIFTVHCDPLGSGGVGLVEIYRLPQ